MWKIIIIFILFVIIVAGLWCIYSGNMSTTPEDEKNELLSEKKEGNEVEPYKAAEEIAPDEELQVVLDEDFRAIFKEVFGKEPKLTSVGEVNILSYVTNRIINVEDINKAGNILQEEGYKIIGRTFSDNEEGVRLSTEINGEEYDNIYILFFTYKEGAWAQRIEVSLL